MSPSIAPYRVRQILSCPGLATAKSVHGRSENVDGHAAPRRVPVYLIVRLASEDTPLTLDIHQG